MKTEVMNSRWRWNFLNIYNAYLERLYKFFGLERRTVHLDEETSMVCWAPKSASKQINTNKTSLLLLHGFGAGATIQWDKQLGPLSKHFNLYIPDLIFFGGSRTTGSGRSEAFQARCAMELMERFAVEQYDVLGFSYGGNIAYKMAYMYPLAVKRLIIMDAGIITTKEDIRKALQSWGEKDMSALQPTDVAGVKKMLRLAYKNPPWVPAFILRDILKGMFSDESKEQKLELMLELRKKLESFSPSDVPVVQQLEAR
eukprot:jgi/Mesen1/5032/ME000025S04435